MTTSSASAGKESLLQRLGGLREIPTLPIVLAPLLRYLQQPVEQLDVQKVTDLIAQDKSLAAQCLQMANSPLFGRWQKTDSLRGAVLSLGFHHVSDIAMSCSIMNMLPSDKTGLDPVVFWEHSLGCALLSRRLARKINLSDPARAYLAGLLHDIGIIANLWVLPQEFNAAYQLGKSEGIPLHEAEQRSLGFTHCDSGGLLAENWGLPASLVDVVIHHHLPNESAHEPELVALVHVADLLCRMSGLNYGYTEQRQVNLFEDSGFALLERHPSNIKGFDWARLTFELDSYMDEVHTLARAIYRA
jgi:HD-like signal output (HDOD) protein